MHHFNRYCDNIENVENYEAAKKDNFKGWHCHHRLETHTSDGEKRPVEITSVELKALDMYYHRPAEELIFLTIKEHNSYKKGKPSPKSEEWKRHQAEAMKGNQCAKGKHWKLSEETKRKIGEAGKGKHWFNNGKVNVFRFECPEGFVPGMLR